MQLLIIFVIGPAWGMVIAYRTWKSRHSEPVSGKYATRCVTSGVAAVLLLMCAKWLNADVRTGLYFLQLACMLAGGLLFGACMGYGLALFLGMASWHKTTRLP